MSFPSPLVRLGSSDADKSAQGLSVVDMAFDELDFQIEYLLQRALSERPRPAIIWNVSVPISHPSDIDSLVAEFDSDFAKFAARESLSSDSFLTRLARATRAGGVPAIREQVELSRHTAELDRAVLDADSWKTDERNCALLSAQRLSAAEFDLNEQREFASFAHLLSIPESQSKADSWVERELFDAPSFDAPFEERRAFVEKFNFPQVTASVVLPNYFQELALSFGPRVHVSSFRVLDAWKHSAASRALIKFGLSERKRRLRNTQRRRELKRIKRQVFRRGFVVQAGPYFRDRARFQIVVCGRRLEVCSTMQQQPADPLITSVTTDQTHIYTSSVYAKAPAAITAKVHKADVAASSIRRLEDLCKRFSLPFSSYQVMMKDLGEIYTDLNGHDLETLAAHVLIGAFEAGCCALCVASLVVPQLTGAASGAIIALNLCEHAHDVAHEATHWRGGKSSIVVQSTSGETTPLGASVSALCKMLSPHVSKVALLNVLTSVAAFAQHPDSWANQLNVCTSFVSGVLSNQPACVGALDDIYEALFRDLKYEPTMFGIPFSLDDISSALLMAEVSDKLPSWLGSLLWIVSKILGLSTTASLTTQLLPKFVLDYCHRGKVTAGSIMKQALDGAWDMVQRSIQCWKEGSLEPMFREVSKVEAVRNAHVFCMMAPADIPGKGEGQALIIDRLSNLRKAEKALYETWHSLPYGNEKAQALRVLSMLTIKVNECMKSWYAPTGRPRSFNAGIVGLPGLGKTFLTTTIFRIICNLHEVVYDDYMWHSHEGSFEFWDDYDPRLQRFIIMDEVGAMSKDKVDNNIYSNLLKLMGEAPFNLPMADLNKIGKFHAAQYATVLTSNVDDFGCDGLLQVPTALFRRLACRIKIAVHPDAAKGKDSVEISADKISGSDPDQALWIGKIQVPIVKSEVRVEWMTVHEFSNVRGFVRGMVPIIASFFKNNEKYTQGSAARARMIDDCCKSERGEVGELPNLGIEETVYSRSMKGARDKAARQEAEDTIPKVKPVEVVSTAGEVEVQEWSPRAWSVRPRRILHDMLECDIWWLPECAYLRFYDFSWDHCARGGIVYTFLPVPWFVPLWWFGCILFAASALKYIWVQATIGASKLGSGLDERSLSYSESFSSAAVSLVDRCLDNVLIVSMIPWPFQWLFMVWRVSNHNSFSKIRLSQLYSRYFHVIPFVMAAFAAYLVWFRTVKCAPTRPRVEVSSTTGEPRYGMTYDEYRSIIKANPIKWYDELKSRIVRAPDLDDAWRRKAMERVIMSTVSKDLLPCAVGRDGTQSLLRHLKAATFSFELECTDAHGRNLTRTGVLFGIGRTWFITAWHVFRIGNVTTGRLRFVPRHPGEQAIGERWHIVEVGINAARVDQSDICILNLSVLPMTSLKDYFPQSVAHGQPPYGTRTTLFRPVGSGFQTEDTYVTQAGNYDDRWERGELAGSGCSCHVAAKSQASMSGSPVVFEAQGRGAIIGGAIVANNVMVSPPMGVVDIVTWPQLERTMRTIVSTQTGLVHTCGIDFSASPCNATTPHYKSWLRNFEGSPKFVVLGSSDRRVSYRSRFVSNPLTDASPEIRLWVREHGGEEYAVPAFKPFLGLDEANELKWYDPQLNKVTSMRGSSTIPPGLLRLAMHEYVSGLPSMSGQPGGVGRLTWEEAVFGCPSRGVPPLSLSKSAGLDGGSKYNHVDVATQTLRPHLLAKVEEIDARLRDGRLAPSEFASMLKAELRKVDKVAKGATRHICPTSFAVLIVQRAYFAPIVLALLRLGVRRSWMAIGMNAANPREWGDLASALLEKAPDGVVSDGDFNAMDAEEGPDSRDIEAAIAGGIAKEIGYSEREYAAVEVLVYCGGFCLIHLDGLIILVLQGRPSGEFATDFFTCIALFILLCCAYYMCAAKAGVVPRPFRESCFIPSVGDDHIRAQSPDTRSWFNASTIHEVLLPTGHIYTTADKTLNFDDDFKSLDKVVFLQRRIVPVQYKGEILYSAPLGLDRVAKSLHIIPSSGSVTMGAHCESIMLNAQRELFLHGRESFIDFTSRIPLYPVAMPDGSVCSVKILSYERLFDEWVSGRMRTFDSGGQLANPEDVERGRVEVESTSGERALLRPAISFLIRALLVYVFLTLVEFSFETFLTLIDDASIALGRGPVMRRPQDEFRRAEQMAGRTAAWERVMIGAALLCMALLGMRGVGIQIESTSGETVNLNTESMTSVPASTATTTMDIAMEGGDTLTPSNPGPSPSFGTQQDFFRRPTILSTTTIASTSTNATNGLFYSINLFDAWVQNVPMLRKWVNNRILRGGVLRVHIHIAATPQHRGAFVIAVTPSAFSWRQNQTNTYSHQAVQMNSRIRNLSGPIAETFDVPLLNCAGTEFLMTQASGRLGTQSGASMLFALLSPLSHCTLATAPSVQMVIRAELVAGNFYSPTDVTAYAVTMQSVSREAGEGVFSRPARIVSDVTRRVANAFPALAPYALPASVIARGVGDLAAAFGFGRPVERLGPMIMAQAPNADLTASNVKDPIFVLSTDSAASTSPSPAAGGWPNEDHMSLAFLAERWAIVGGSSLGSEWSTSTGVGVVIMTVPISPYTVDAGADSSLGYCMQPVSVIGNASSYWRGTCELKVVVFAGSLDVGRLRVFWVPGQGTITGTLDDTHFYSCIIDIQDKKECTMCIGWQDVPTVLPAPTTYATLPATAYASAAYSAGSNNGVLVIKVDGSLVSNQATTAVGVKVFMRWKDITFMRPSVRLLNNLQYTSGEFEVPSHGDPRDIMYVQSEKTDHLRQLLTRYFWSATFRILKNAMANTAGTSVGAFPPWGWDGSSVPTLPGNMLWSFRSATPWDYAVKCYAVYRGGAKTRLVTNPGVNSTIQQWLFGISITGLALYGTISVLVANIVGTSFNGANSLQTSVSNYDGSNVGCVDGVGTSVFRGTGELAGAQVPYRDTWPWRYTSPIVGGPPLPNASQTPYELLLLGCSFTDVQVATTTTDSFVDMYRAYADDIVLHGFICCPIISSGLWPNH